MIKYLFLLLPILGKSKELGIYTLGLSYHGYGMNNKNVAKKVPHKLDSTGKLTYHPEFSIMYNNKYLYGFTFLKNTFNNDAYMLSFGKSYKLLEYTNVGFMGSLYINEREPGITEPRLWRNNNYNVILFPWLFIKQDIKITKNINLSTFLTSNFFLSHLALGTSIKL